ncbi:hypothetical protein Peur_068802 [Populus x canadensis]
MYQKYREMTDMFWNIDELNRHLASIQARRTYVAASATGSRNTVSERNRRKKLNDKLYALREAVPRISKADVEEKDHLRLEIEGAISALSGPYNPQGM